MRIRLNEKDKKELNTLFYALPVGLGMIIALFYFVLKPEEESGFVLNFDYLTIVAIGAAIIAPLLGPNLQQTALSQIKESDSEEEKTMSIRKALVMNWAVIEGAGLINAIFFFTFNNTLFLLLAVLMLILLIMNRPQFEE